MVTLGAHITEYAWSCGMHAESEGFSNVQIIEVVRVGRVVSGVPLLRGRVAGQALLGLALVVDAVDADHLLEEVVQVGVLGGIDRHLEQRTEDVW